LIVIVAEERMLSTLVSSLPARRRARELIAAALR
jgi:hypothetical protein